MSHSKRSDRFSDSHVSLDSPPSILGPVDLPEEATGADSALLALGKQFEEMAAEVQKLINSASRDGHLEKIEAMLDRLQPVEKAIMAMPARTVAGLGVKAQHAAYVMSELWNGPIDRIDWNAQAARLLIEAVCKNAGTPLPFQEAPETER